MKSFVFYNPNPAFKNSNKNWNRGDCVIRALAKATGEDWKSVYVKSFNAAMKVFDLPDNKLGLEAVLKEFGFIKGSSLKPLRGEKWPTVKEMAKLHKKEIIFCNCCGHVVCCMNGCYYDVWDSGEYTVRSYWIYNK